MSQPYAEDVNYWKTGSSAPDAWIDKAEAEIRAAGGKVLSEAFGNQDGRAAFMLEFTFGGDRFRAVWPVLPSKTKAERAARVQAATMLYHDVKAKCVSAKVHGARAAFFQYAVLPDGRTAADVAAPELLAMYPKRYRTHKSNWIRGILADGLQPILTVVEIGIGAGWEIVERKWIAAYRAQGCKLTNATNGGNGAMGRVITPETRQKISATKKARGIPPESRERIIAASRGRKQTPEHKKKAADVRRGWKQTPEAREKIGAFNRGKKQSPEHTAKAIAGRKAKGGWHVTPENIEKMAAALRGKKRDPKAVQQGIETRQMNPQRCGTCRELGHNRLTCPQRDAKEK